MGKVRSLPNKFSRNQAAAGFGPGASQQFVKLYAASSARRPHRTARGSKLDVAAAGLQNRLAADAAGDNTAAARLCGQIAAATGNHNRPAAGLQDNVLLAGINVDASASAACIHASIRRPPADVPTTGFHVNI